MCHKIVDTSSFCYSERPKVSGFLHDGLRSDFAARPTDTIFCNIFATHRAKRADIVSNDFQFQEDSILKSTLVVRREHDWILGHALSMLLED